MKKILLVADAGGEIGWGHAMRTLAVAEELSGRSGVQAVWVTETPKEVHSLKPPIPIYACGPHEDMSSQHGSADFVLIDLSGELYPAFGEYNSDDYRVWYMVDHGTGLQGTNRICPHFGAEERDWGPGAVVCGPRWMPLRKPIGGNVWTGEPRYSALAPVLLYRAPDGIETLLNKAARSSRRLTEGEEWWCKQWSGAIVPPSTIAYECMRLGIPVSLVQLPNDQPRDVGDAMVKAGVADSYAKSGYPQRHLDSRERWKTTSRIKRLVDGRGAERVADLLERW